MSAMSTKLGRTVRLSKVESAYLANTTFLSADLAGLIGAAGARDDGRLVLELDHATAERFRDEFTTRLAKVGFDANYDPTREGAMLEELIDRFSR